MAEFESVVDYSTKLDNFEGPLDLLLHLIKEAKIEIKDVFVSQVTEQFLLYINGVDQLDVDKASDYLNMAATLLEIKSKSILPKIDEYLDEPVVYYYDYNTEVVVHPSNAGHEWIAPIILKFMESII